jgi:membrane fusion protein, multidrug efflux system
MNASPAARISCLVALIAAGCSSSEAGLPQLPDPNAGAGAPIEVPVATVTEEVISVPVIASGATEALRAADLGPQLTAQIAAVLVQEGDEVVLGQPLIRLDVRDASLRASQAVASASSANVQAQLAESEYQRIAPLAARGTIATQQADQLQAQRDAAAGAARAAQAMVAQARRGVAEAVVRAPFAGTISQVMAEVGEVATMMPPTILLRLVDLSEVEVSVRVHERDLARIATGDEVQVRFPSIQQTSAGRVTFISPEIDPRSRTATVTTRIPNPMHNLRSGLFAELKIQPTQQRRGLIAPRTAVMAGEEAAVFAIKGDRAERRTVTIAPVDDEHVEVLTGLRAGEAIAAGGLDRLSDGALVRPVAPRGTPPGAAAAAVHAPPAGGAQAEAAR